ncbi:hypothetical protein LSM04_003173 [Trypanosoma melophagium]|uniref:uncharacterized protein n=1 Tax=Trypanosoma melophagium TaxID=715481 RepID=UPI00351A07D3|nr:hypothetical protein LSM04_003173 [Trypanosoma melophagium]
MCKTILHDFILISVPRIQFRIFVVFFFVFTWPLQSLLDFVSQDNTTADNISTVQFMKNIQLAFSFAIVYRDVKGSRDALTAAVAHKGTWVKNLIFARDGKATRSPVLSSPLPPSH